MTSAAELYIDLRERGLRLRVDEDDRLIVSPGNRLSAADRTAIRRHKDELMAMVSIDAGPEKTAVPLAAPTAGLRATPSACRAPRVCLVLGLCGRWACVPEAERTTFEVAVFNARAESNPHRVADSLDDPGVAA